MHNGGATFSPCGKFRFRLWRNWGAGPRLLFVMLNPSTADGMQNDPTIRKCIGFAQRHGYAGIEVGNLFAYRATDPQFLRGAGYPTGGEVNDATLSYLSQVSRSAGVPIICAWGAQARGLSRVDDVVQILLKSGTVLMTLGLTRDGIPRHPLMLPYDSQLEVYDP